MVLDAPDAGELAGFYASLLEWEIYKAEPAFVTVAPPDGVAYLACQTAEGYQRPVWPNAAQAQQMMMHLDFEVSDLETAVGHAIELGAVQAEFQPQSNVRVMLDPAGHPFCLYT
ncbi:glyoxalase [Rhizocola hellebori]|uniref:Glyoxalase n=1 Tax=Rhizocola hellebori TaxID=1392758 RepID=A0A8J3QDY4_9ACTN|nr:glyoxalase [Rhizocola hellebori]